MSNLKDDIMILNMMTGGYCLSLVVICLAMISGFIGASV